MEEVCNLSWYQSNGVYSSCTSAPTDPCPTAYVTRPLDWRSPYHIKGRSSDGSCEDCNRMALACLSSSRRRMGSKPVACPKAFVSSVKPLYYEATWLVLPLPDNEGKIYKKRWKENIRITIRSENKWKRSSNNQIRVFECQHTHVGLRMRTQGLNMRMQFGSCILMNWRTWMRMHEYSLHTQK